MVMNHIWPSQNKTKICKKANDKVPLGNLAYLKKKEETCTIYLEDAHILIYWVSSVFMHENEWEYWGLILKLSWATVFAFMLWY